jgi:hypothetical protein
MPGIAFLTIEQFRDRIRRFDSSYIRDWDEWSRAFIQKRNVASELGRVLRRWQACRPNRMRRSRSEGGHDFPFLEDLVAQAEPYLEFFHQFEIAVEASFTPEFFQAITQLWSIFRELSYHGKARDGKAGIVGISKAILLLTLGRVGPAFDSEVRRQLNIHEPITASQWIEALKLASRDIQIFEMRNQIAIQQAAPQEFQRINSGRLYDMALGPGE